VFSAIGIFMFFAPITIGGTSTIPLDHIVTAIRTYLAPVVPFLILALILVGTARPFLTGSWKKSPSKVVFSFLNIIGLVVAGLIVPVGAVVLALLVSYGLMEYIGVIVQPVMRPVFKTPGRSAVDAVASFVGSYSLGLLITNRVYKDGRYTAREAAIVATGFST